MVQQLRVRDRQESTLAAWVAGGATVGGMATPVLFHAGGHTGAEFIGLAVLIVGPVVFLVVALITLFIFRAGGARLHFLVLAAITAAIAAALTLVPAAIGGLASVLFSVNGSLVAAGAVFLGLVLTIALRRRRRAVREAELADAAVTGSQVRQLRFRLGIVALVAGLAAWIPAILAPIAGSFEYFDGPPTGAYLSGLIGPAILLAVPIGLVAAWAVVVVVLVDQLVAPRILHALAVAVLAAVPLVSMPLILSGGFEEGGANAVWALASAVAAAVVLFLSEGRGRAVPAMTAGDPAIAQPTVTSDSRDSPSGAGGPAATMMES